MAGGRAWARYQELGHSDLTEWAHGLLTVAQA